MRDDDLLTPRQVCEILNIEMEALKKMRQRGEIPYMSLSKRTKRYLRRDIERLKRNRYVGAAGLNKPLSLVERG